jgi:hypothetical protein
VWSQIINPRADSVKNVTIDLAMGCLLRVRWSNDDDQVTAQGMHV